MRLLITWFMVFVNFVMLILCIYMIVGPDFAIPVHERSQSISDEGRECFTDSECRAGICLNGACGNLQQKADHDIEEMLAQQERSREFMVLASFNKTFRFKGIPGIRGKQGPKGDRGLQGEGGERGPRGYGGVAFRGETGDPGDSGDPGQPGDKGVTGKEGPVGLDGPGPGSCPTAGDFPDGTIYAPRNLDFNGCFGSIRADTKQYFDPASTNRNDLTKCPRLLQTDYYEGDILTLQYSRFYAIYRMDILDESNPVGRKILTGSANDDVVSGFFRDDARICPASAELASISTKVGDEFLCGDNPTSGCSEQDANGARHNLVRIPLTKEHSGKPDGLNYFVAIRVLDDNLVPLTTVSCTPSNILKVVIQVRKPGKPHFSVCPVRIRGGAGGSSGVDIDNRAMVEKLQGIVNALARQLVMQQAQQEQWVRAQGGSGLANVRSYSGGTEDYFDASFGNSESIAAIHDHANSESMVGMGEVSAVLNGVEFYTTHNDYGLRMNCPSATRNNNDFLREDLSEKSWTNFPIYKATHDFLKSKMGAQGYDIQDAHLHRAVTETCHLICAKEKELSDVPDDKGNVKRLRVRDAVISDFSARVDSERTLPTFPTAIWMHDRDSPSHCASSCCSKRRRCISQRPECEKEQRGS